MEKKVIATEWQNMNNPARSVGLFSSKELNPEGVQSHGIEPFQGFGPATYSPPVTPEVIQIQALWA